MLIVTDTKDMPTEHNSPIYKDHRPNVDAVPVGVCRAAGALIFGKTVSCFSTAPARLKRLERCRAICIVTPLTG
jgi:hypothetical protein